MNLVVTGGAGFIGSNFVKEQIGHWEKITVLDSLTYAGNLENIRDLIASKKIIFKRIDISDSDSISGTLNEVDTVVNFAAESHVDRSIKNAKTFTISNVLGTQCLLEESLKSEVRRFIQISTDEVYGTIESGSWDENCILDPSSPYSASKASGDLIALAYSKTFGLDVRITRCSNNYGPFQNIEKLIPKTITNLLQGKKIPIYGNGQNIRDWLHVSDHCRAIKSVIEKGEIGNIYNIGGGAELTNLQLIAIILELLGFGLDQIEHVSDRLGHDFRYSVNYDKLKTLASYTPTIPIESGLESTIDWYRNNTGWWTN